MAPTAPATAAELFEVEQTGDTIIVTALADLSELGYRQIEAEGKAVLDMLAQAPGRNVVVDFGRTDYWGSTALGLLVGIWKRVRSRGGRMALCRLSPHEKEILQISHLDHVWPMFPSRGQALKALRGW
jgi:anti-anti-sigma factor